jgi:hypothetical protein
LLISGFTAQAITNTAIAVSGTNIVLSWPSYGYESYLIQYRQTLDPSDSWSALTNAYHANSTNRTTFTIYGVVPPPTTGGGSGNGYYISGLSPSLNLARSSIMAGGMGPLAVPLDGSGSTVPVVLYPPGFDFSNFNIFDPLTGESVSGVGYTAPLLHQSALLSRDDAQPLDSGSGDPPQTGFYCVFHIPSFPASITNYTFDGPTFIPVDYASPDADPSYVDSTTVLIGGQPMDYAVFMPYVYGGVTNWGVGIYFDQLPNGTNTIQLLTTVRQSDDLNDQTPYMVFSNAPAVITVGNLVTFTNWDDLIWNNTNYTFKAQTVANVDWEIDIYDGNNNFVNSQTGHSGDGNIAWTWDLYDYLGNLRSDPFFYPYITITQNSGSSAQGGGIQPNAGGSTTRPMPAAATPFPSVGQWIVAYMDKFYDDGTTNYAGADSYYIKGINAIAGGPIEWNVPATEFPLKFGRTYSQADRDSSWINLTSWLYDPNSRNFYYFGHGAANSIGGDISVLDSSNNITGAKDLPNSKAHLSSQYVHDTVTFNRYSGARPYRFVFLDGCDTANANWPWAFGVPKQDEPLSYYNSSANTRHTRPSVFLGWDVTIGGKKDWGTVDKFWAFRTDWMENWAGIFQEPLDQSLSDANFIDSNWVDAGHFSHLKEYGYKTMGFFDYNYGGDWP